MVVNGFAAGLAESIDHVEHAAADAGAKVVDMDPGFVSQLFHGRDVAIGEVHHVDIIAYAGAILGRVVVTKHGQRVATTNGDLGDVRHQVVWDPLRVFPHVARRVGADRVEVAQQGNAPLRLGFLQVGQDLLYHQLAFAVRALRGAGREAFDIRDFRLIAVDGSGGAKDKVLHASGAHGRD